MAERTSLKGFLVISIFLLVLVVPGIQQAKAGDVPFGDANTIDGDFVGAFCVHAADIDSDGDMDMLGAAYSADDVTWWEGACECLGDTNGGDGFPDGKISLSDVTRLINLIKDDGDYSVQLNELSLDDQEVYLLGDCAGGDGNPDGAISLSDVTRVINFIKDEPGYINDSCICLDGGVVVSCE